MKVVLSPAGNTTNTQPSDSSVSVDFFTRVEVLPNLLPPDDDVFLSGLHDDRLQNPGFYLIEPWSEPHGLYKDVNERSWTCTRHINTPNGSAVIEQRYSERYGRRKNVPVIVEQSLTTINYGKQLLHTVQRERSGRISHETKSPISLTHRRSKSKISKCK